MLRILSTSALICVTTLYAQNTVGLLENDHLLAQPGYTLFYPDAHENVYLIDNCGMIVHKWVDQTYTASNAIYFMENGDLVRCGKSAASASSGFQAGGAGEMVDRRTWNGELVWRYTYNTPNWRMHHDVAMLPNGNVLIVAWEYRSLVEAIQAGLDTASNSAHAVWPDHIIEVQPQGVDAGDIVWEWHAWDHLVQDHDPSLPNYGIVADRPERIDINYQPQVAADWHHTNSIDHDPVRDRILLCVPTFNEIWVIDHSTTSQEAATSSGGSSGQGGDLLYRWGNPMAYDRGTEDQQRLFFQHDATWLGENANDPDLGKILLFNNRSGENSSSVDIIAPELDEFGHYNFNETYGFEPENAEWRYTASEPSTFFSNIVSGAQKLPNGNVLICSGRQGWFFEVDPTGEIVWQYILPIEENFIVAQGTEILNSQLVFRATKIPADHPFLSDQAPDPIGYIELEPMVGFCGTLSVNATEFQEQDHVVLYPNPARSSISISASPGSLMTITDLIGKTILVDRIDQDPMVTDIGSLANGVYVLAIENGGKSVFVVQK